MPQLKSKLPQTSASIFSVMSRLAHEHQAINLAQGFPDFPCDPKLIELVDYYMKKGNNQYAPMQGVRPLREVLAEKVNEAYQCSFDESHVIITSGATQGLYTAISAVVGQGDEVIILEPSYDSYSPAVRVQGGVPVFVQLSAPEYRIPWDQVKEAISSRTKMLIINSPHNPTGSILRAEDIVALEKIVEETGIIILSDEVYEHLVFDENKHISLLSSEIIRNHCLACFSFGKVLHVTGWKLGYVVGPQWLILEFGKVHQFTVFSCNTPMQLAVADYYKEKKYNELPDFFKKKRDLINEAISQSRLECVPTPGTYFQTVNYSKVSDEDDRSFAERITKENKLASIPVSAFFHNAKDEKVIRLCFAKQEETLLRAGEILCKL